MSSLFRVPGNPDIRPPKLLITDSYKQDHFEQYPDNIIEMNAYETCRGHFTQAGLDRRILFSGMRYLFDQYISQPFEWADLIQAAKYNRTHEVTGEYPMAHNLWKEILETNNGYFPVKIEVLREGTTILPGVPTYQITAKGKFVRLATWLEPILTWLWSPITTGTKSRIVREHLEQKFINSVDPELMFLLDSRLHDFGLRGAVVLEAAMSTGLAHLLSFDGTDNQPAGWLATQYNGGVPVGTSVRATEHSVMTSWPSELACIKHMSDNSPNGALLSVVADSYDYMNFLHNIVPQTVDFIRAKNQVLIVRPDSGDWITNIENGLTILAKHFGFYTNSKGYTCLKNAAMIQGDGMNVENVIQLSNAVEDLKFSAQNVAYGMGGGLLQDQTRDTLRVATKLNEIVVMIDDPQTERIPVMKRPKTDMTKASLPGRLRVENVNGNPLVMPEYTTYGGENMLETIWDCGPVPYEFETFDKVRERAIRTWKEVNPSHDPISKELKAKIQMEMSKANV